MDAQPSKGRMTLRERLEQLKQHSCGWTINFENEAVPNGPFVKLADVLACLASPDEAPICPSYICAICYHEKDTCSHCDKPDEAPSGCMEERERCAKQIEAMAFSVARICSEPGAGDVTRELGRVRIEAFTDAAAAIRSARFAHPTRRPRGQEG